MNTVCQKHQFALYWHGLSERLPSINELLTINNPDLFHRLIHVLRLKSGEQPIFFDHYKHCEVTIIDFSKKNTIIVRINTIKENQILKPHITFLLPLLKREAFERVIYNLVELGANEIQLIITQKIHRKWGGQKERARLEKIMIAAAEQSKNFAIPSLHEPIILEQILKNINKQASTIFFDAQGLEAETVIQKTRQEKPEDIILLVGPEGDLTVQEKQAMEKKFIFCKLTPTILRVEQAVVVGIGILRSLL